MALNFRPAYYFFGGVLALLAVSGAAHAAHLYDPFSPSGNQSLVLDNFAGGDTDPNRWPFVWWDLGDDFTDGTFEFDLYMENDDPGGVPDKFWTYVNLRIGTRDGALPSGSGGDTAIFDSFRVQSEAGRYYYNNATAPAVHPFEHSTAHHVKYTIDGTAKTYRVEVTPFADSGVTDVIEIDFGSGLTADLPWRSQFQLPPPFGSGNTTFDTIAIGGAFAAVNGNYSAPFFIDNVVFISGGNTILSEDFESTPLGGLPADPKFNSLGPGVSGYRVEVVGAVPEPGAIGLAGMATAGVAGALRRRPRQPCGEDAV